MLILRGVPMDKVLKTLLLGVDLSTFSGGFSIFVSPPYASTRFRPLSYPLALQLRDQLVDLDLQLSIMLYLAFDGSEGVHNGGVVL